MKTTVINRRYIGEIGVDAGLCWVGDPCYILHREELPQSIGKNWGEFCQLVRANSNEYTQFAYDLGHPGLGMVVSTGYGDGVYPVYAEFNGEGRIAKVSVEFMGQDDESGNVQEA